MKSALIPVGLILFGLAYIVLAMRLPGPRPDDVLGPASVPVALGSALVFLAGVLGTRGLLGGGGDRDHAPLLRSHVVVLVGLFAYIAAVPLIGFKLATGLFLLLAAIWGGHRPVVAAILALVATAIFHLLFNVLFKVSLPRGAL